MQAEGGGGESLCTELRAVLKKMRSKGGSLRTSILEFKEAKLQPLAWRRRHLKKVLGPGLVGGKGLHLRLPCTIYKGFGPGGPQQAGPRCCQILGRNDLRGRGKQETGDRRPALAWELAVAEPAAVVLVG